MDKTNKILLNKTRTYNSVNVNSQIQIDIDATNKPIPLNDINTTVSQFEQFEKERKESTIYRFYGNITPLVSNPLFNDNVKITGNSSTVGAKKIFSSDIFEKDGWVGYFNNDPNEGFNDNKSSLCDFTPFDPGYDRLKLLDINGVPNYLFKITYPFRTKDIQIVKNTAGVTLKDGIPIIKKFIVILNGRQYTGFKTAINHGLSQRDEISLFNFIDNTGGDLTLTDKTYRVFKVGNKTNDDKFRSFVIDIDPLDIDIEPGGVSTIKRVSKDYISSYYVREFKSLTTEYKDYDIYPAAFGTSYYNDNVVAFNFKKDIDVDGLVDNLNRPLSELYFTIIKNDEDSDNTSINTRYWLEQQEGLPSQIKNRFWTPIVAGYDIENNENINYNIRAFGDSSYNSNIWYPDNVNGIDETDEIFDGDIVEYNPSELNERRLESIYHRVNTIYREHLNTIDNNKEDKKEGYIYKPFKKIQIREFSNDINPIVDLQSIIDKYNITTQSEIEELTKSFGVPDYVINNITPSGINTGTIVAPNIYRWRDLLEIGEVDTTGGGVEYPFESGAHYININNRFFFQRQDPPCEYIIISEEVTLGATAPPVDEERFLNYLSSPTFLNYGFQNPEDIDLNAGGVTNLSNYNGNDELVIDINLAEFVGDYDLGVRDVPGGCIDLSALKVKDIDDDC